MWGKFQDQIRDACHKSDVILAIGVIGLILLLIVPLPPVVLDLLLCLNLVFSVMALLLTLYVEQALEFSSFPSALLFLTLYRLGLNIASTRMILTQAQAGDIIETFGEFVTGGHIGVGLILFALLTTINFIVVTKGAGRVAEVAARFTLEALPGKQMAVDGELNAGLITQDEARERHKKIEQEAEFYGAMDGASKFVRGDAIAGILITIVNIFGGFCVGICIKQLPISECWDLFTRLTVGDGLMSQLPALLVSVGAGIMVTRTSSHSLGKMLGKQLFCRPKVLVITAILLLFMGLIPGMPLIVMAPIASILILYAVAQWKIEQADHPLIISSKSSDIELELGPMLAGKVLQVRDNIFEELKKVEQHLGIKLPHCKIKDNTSLSPSAFELKIGGSVAGRARADLSDLAQKIAKTISLHCHELLCRQDVVRMLDTAKRTDHAVVKELIPKKISVGQLLVILQNLLKEGVSIGQFQLILEALADSMCQMGEVNTDVLTEKVRERLSRAISEQFFGKTHTAYTIRLDPKVEKMIAVSTTQQTQTTQERLRPQVIEKITKQLSYLQQMADSQGNTAVLITDPALRLKLRRLIQHHLPQLPVLSYNELSADVTIETLGTVSKEVLLP